MVAVPQQRPAPKGQPDIIAERAVLGAVLAQPQRLAVVATLVKPEDFFCPPHGALFEVLLELDRAGTPIDSVTVLNALKASGKLEQLGGVEGVLGFDTEAPSAANAEHYARIVAEAGAFRRVRAVHRLQAQAMDAGVGTAREFAQDAQEALEVAVQAVQQGGFVPMAELVDRSVDHLLQVQQVQGGITGVATGYTELDRMTTGLHPGELAVLAARPGVGKTALALNIGLNIARAAGAVAIFSLEMPAMQLALRALASEGRASLRRLREGGMSDTEMNRLGEAAQRIRGVSMFVDDTAAITLQDVRARSKTLKQTVGKLSLVVVDYLQLMGRGGKWQNREAEVGENSRGLKQLAKELDAPVLALAQMNRKVEERAGGKPLLSDLRESGSIEADADIVMFIHPDDEAEGDEVRRRERRPVNLVVAKQRNGPTGDVPLDFIAESTRFEPRPWNG